MPARPTRDNHLCTPDLGSYPAAPVRITALPEPTRVNLHIDIDQETDGRWIAEVVDLPGALAYGASRDDALAAATVLAFRVIADRLEAGELRADDCADVHFIPAAA